MKEDADANPAQEYPIEDTKMILFVRTDLNMGKGKIGA